MIDTYEYDVFISHASEDKDGLVRPLVAALEHAGLRVWYDETSLSLGDNLRRSIDDGLAKSRFGVVVLSKNFFAKQWPQRELDGLTGLEMSDGRKRILPVWHELTQTEVAAYSPPLSVVLATNTARGQRAVVAEILRVVASTSTAPLRSTYVRLHRDTTLDLVALSREGGGILVGHHFKNCILRGPAVLLLDEYVDMVGLTFDHAMLWPVETGRSYIGGIPIRESRIENSTFENVGIGGNPHTLNRIYYLPAPGDSTPDEGPVPS